MSSSSIVAFHPRWTSADCLVWGSWGMPAEIIDVNAYLGFGFLMPHCERVVIGWGTKAKGT